MDMGGVASLGNVKNAIAVAKYVLKNVEHSLIVGDLATNFALGLGFKEESLQTNYSENLWLDWKENQCQPNFWKVCFWNFKNVDIFLCTINLF